MISIGATNKLKIKQISFFGGQQTNKVRPFSFEPDLRLSD